MDWVAGTDDEHQPDGPIGGVEPRIPGIAAAVVTVGHAASGRTGARPPRSPWTAMESYTSLIRRHTPLRALRLPMTTGDPAAVAARIGALAPRVAVAFVTGLNAEDSSRIKGEVAARGGPLVLTELDTVTAALAATTISTLRRRGIAPRSGRVVVTRPEAAPLLGATLVRCGIGQVTNWRTGDAQAFPLRRLMEGHDALIDLAGAAVDTDAPGRTVRPPADPHELGRLVLPGLIGALCGHDATGVSAEVLAAAARALALTTPPGQVLPGPDDGLVPRAIAREVGRVLAPPADRNRHS